MPMMTYFALVKKFITLRKPVGKYIIKALIVVAIVSLVFTLFVGKTQRSVRSWQSALARQRSGIDGQSAVTGATHNLSFPGHESVCDDAVPTLYALQRAAARRHDGLTEFTHSVCCRGAVTEYDDQFATVEDATQVDVANETMTFGLAEIELHAMVEAATTTVPDEVAVTETAVDTEESEAAAAIIATLNQEPLGACGRALKAIRAPLQNVAAALASRDLAVDLANTDVNQSLVLVTASSADHFIESLAMVRSVQKYMRGRRLLYWDIGLTAAQAAAVRRLCGVEYRRFDTSKYPPHVANLLTYAFKPLIIMESFAESPVLWWADASVRFTASRVDHVLEIMRQRHGLVLFREPTHSVWSTTYAQTYDYLATQEEGLMRTVTAPGTSFLVANTPEMFSTVLFWFYACSLDERCIAPVTYPEPCNVTEPYVFANCHRFDQSVLTLLAANVWGFGSDDYRFEQDMFEIRRDEWDDKRVAICPPHKAR